MVSTRSEKSAMNAPSEGSDLIFPMQTSPCVVTCEQLCTFLDDYLAGKLTPSQQHVFDLHLSLSQSCHLYVENYRQTTHLRKDQFCDAHLSDCKEMSEALINAILSTRNMELDQ